MVNNSDRTFFIQLILWTTANGISAISSCALIFAIARSPKVRSISFNLYLLFSILPDAYKNTSGFFSNLANLVMTNGNPNACVVIGWNDAYWWCANLWMACIVFGHLRELLVANKNAQHHQPPAISRVIKESVSVHIFAIVMASLTLIPAGFIPKATAMSGCEAYPEDGNKEQHVFYWAFYLPMTALFPTMWVTGLCFDIWWRELLPVNGKSRSLLFYFARLLLVIYIVTLAVIISFLFGGWAQAIAFIIFNLVGFLSVCLALLKKDIMKCWKQLWTCQSPDELVSDDNANPDAERGTRTKRKIDFSIFYVDSLRKSVQSIRHLDKSVPNNNFEDDGSYINNDNPSRTVRFEGHPKDGG